VRSEFPANLILLDIIIWAMVYNIIIVEYMPN
jgi:hypothetical protein